MKPLTPHSTAYESWREREWVPAHCFNWNSTGKIKHGLQQRNLAWNWLRSVSRNKSSNYSTAYECLLLYSIWMDEPKRFVFGLSWSTLVPSLWLRPMDKLSFCLFIRHMVPSVPYFWYLCFGISNIYHQKKRYTYSEWPMIGCCRSLCCRSVW